MLAVITLTELEKLYRDHKISKSESFEFLEPNTQDFLAAVFEEENETPMAKLIHIHSVGSKEINEVDREVLDDNNDDLLAFLPLVEGDQILIITKPSDKLLLFSDNTLDEIGSVTIITDEEKDFYKELLLDGDSGAESCLYAVSTEIKLEDVIAVVYPESLEEAVAELKDKNKDRDVLYQTTALFN